MATTSYPHNVPTEILEKAHFAIAFYAGYTRCGNGLRMASFYDANGLLIWSHGYTVGRSGIPTGLPAVPVDVAAGYLRILRTSAKQRGKYSETD